MAEATAENDLSASTELQEASTADQIANPVPWREAPVYRQIAVLVLLALAISIGVAVALWSKEPNYTSLFAEMTHEDANKIAEVLKTGDVPFRVDQQTGSIMVPSSQVRQVRMRLAAQGLPESSGVGLEILQSEQDLSTSQFIESARYNHALETELSRSISTLKNIKGARVHLALPKQSIFVRNQKKPSASVIVQLYQGRVLEQVQIASIVHLVSSSIANMESAAVTVVDQHGRLLTDGNSNTDLAMSAKQFEYRRELERDYSERIVSLLEPIVGYGKVRAQVTAELNFTRVESTEEKYNQDEDDPRRVLRSEQTTEEENRLDRAIGVPGALTNQPPGAGTTDEEGAAADQNGSSSSSRAATRNYEVDRVISHQQNSLGDIRRLAVAVVIDDKEITVNAPLARDIATTPEGSTAETPQLDGENENAGEGEDASEETTGVAEDTRPSTRREAYTPEEIERITNLIRQVIGFNEARGDTINVMNSAFFTPEVGVLPELPLWEQIWVQDLIKQVLSGIFILLLLVLIVRPIVRGLIPTAEEEPEEDDDEDDDDEIDSDDDAVEGELEEAAIVWGDDGRPIDTDADASKMQYDKKLSYARILVLEDPARAATVMKVWMNETEEEKDAA
ncbi:MAG: flagellar basal-body MS-ring/collar protein FliF [Pseudomonadota bacterium]